jgi:D-lactate dehydrogenase (cytochrome)
VKLQIHTDVAANYADYLKDESRKAGCADSISFPLSADEVCATLKWAAERGLAVTTQGSRTGITGGASPDGGHVLNLSRMKGVRGLARHGGREVFVLTVEPGVTLADVNRMASARQFDTTAWNATSRAALEMLAESQTQYVFAPDLTETSASIGGLLACNASGARSYLYGAARRHVERIVVALADGDTLELRRGAHRAWGRRFSVVTAGGRRIEGLLPSYRMPDVKNASGFYAAENMDLIDLFIGAEGTLGVLVEADILLIPAPPVLWGITVFLPDEAGALRLVEEARRKTCPTAIEFMNHGALDLLRRMKASNPAFAAVPDLPARWHTGIYVEYQGRCEDDTEMQVAMLSEILAACGGDPDATWLATDARGIERFKTTRHAIPEAVNLLIDERRRTHPRLTKLGTDLAVPDAHLQDVMRMYREDLGARGLESVTFGHIGNNHVHVNIIPRSMEEYEAGRALYLHWARRVVALGGSVSAEHGIGKLKAEMLKLMYGAEGIEQMRAVKRCFDPQWRLNRGNLFSLD